VKQENTSPYYKRTHDILDRGDVFDELVDRTDSEGIEVAGIEDGSDDDKEKDEEGLFVPEQLYTPPSTTRQLAHLVQKHMDNLYELSAIIPGKPENARGYEFVLRQAVDKVRFAGKSPVLKALHYFLPGIFRELFTRWTCLDSRERIRNCLHSKYFLFKQD
jgi:hypothetical protein